jgi:hypothetical protein
MRDHLHQTLVPPLIARVLADEQHYGDGAPIWVGAPTSSGARKPVKGTSSGCGGLQRNFQKPSSWPTSWPVAKSVADA